MSKELIVKHNKLIEANYKLTLQEQKLILTLAREISKEDNNFKKCVFTVEKLSDILGLEKKGYYSELKEITKSLISRVIQIKEPDGLLQVSWLNSAKYYKNKGIVELSFSNDLKPYLLQLGEHFTKLEFNKMVTLNSVYAVRVYELCKQYEKIKERKIELIELRKILGANEEKSYEIYNRFKVKVLSVAKREINEKTDINISFEEIKTGRKVTSIKFLIEKKEIEKVENKIDFEIEELEKFKDTEEKNIKEYSEEVLKLFKILPLEEQIESSKEKLENLLKNHSFKFIEADTKYAKKSKVKNFWGYLLKSCDNGHYSKDEVEKVEIKKINTENKLKQMQLMEEKAEEEKLRIEKENRLREKALEFYEKLNEDIKEKIKEKAKELYIQEGEIKDFNLVKKIYQTTLEKLYIHRVIRNTFQDLIED